MNDRRIGVTEVLEKFGVGPEKVGDVLALMGDERRQLSRACRASVPRPRPS